MISFRYHIVSIVSVFLALAVGVALGGGPLKGEVDNTLVEQVEADRKAKADLRAQIGALGAANEFTDDYAAATAPDLIGGDLDGRAVTLLVLPGAEEATISSLTELVEVAGGSVGGTIRAGEGLLDVGNKQLVDELGSQLLDGVNDVTVPEDAGTYERLGAILARAVATDEDGGATVDDAANSILSGLSTADLMSPAGDLDRRGSLVLVVSGAGSDDPDMREAAGAVVTALVDAMDDSTDGVVVAGPIAAARPGDVIDSVRREVVTAREVSTVDTLDRVSGEVVSVMALAEQAAGGAGHYGSVDAADGVMPAAGAAEEAPAD
ncbi:MAG TPA: copper transporter [Nocardioidaceae bacterium]|nr:copper transporter [Nocardioidaceae bacterium]